MTETLTDVVERPSLTGRIAYPVSIALMFVGIVLAFVGMREVMDVGGACASGGPYVAVQPCPTDSAVYLAVGIPLAVVALFVSFLSGPMNGASVFALMWGGLFGAMGWNFLAYGLFDGSLDVGWLICGVLFWLMAAPAVWILVRYVIFNSKLGLLTLVYVGAGTAIGIAVVALT